MANIPGVSNSVSPPLTGASQQELAELRAEVGIERLSDAAHQTVERVADTMSSVARDMAERSGRLRDSSQRWALASRTAVSRHPVTAVALALAAGAIIGGLVSRNGNDDGECRQASPMP